MKNFKNRLFLIVLILFSTAIFWSCESSSNDKDTTKIGAILPMTGEYADLGDWVYAGIDLAVDEINERDSLHQYSLILEDAMSEASGAVSAYNKLVNTEDVDIIITATSSLSLALKPKAIRDSVLFFGIGSHPKITQGNNNLIFRPSNTSTDEAQEIAEYITSNLDERDSWILYYNSEFGQSFNSQIEELLGEDIVGSSPFGDDPESFRNIVSRAISNNPDIIISIGFTPSMGNLVRTIREQNFNGEVVANIGFSSPSVLNIAGDAANGVKYVDYNLPENSEHYRNLNDLAQERYNTNFSSFSYLSYGTVIALNQAVNKQGSNSINEIASYLRSPRTIDVKGFEFNTKTSGDIVPSLHIKEYHDE